MRTSLDVDASARTDEADQPPSRSGGCCFWSCRALGVCLFFSASALFGAAAFWTYTSLLPESDPNGSNDDIVTKASASGAQIPWASKGNRVMKQVDEVNVSTAAAADDYELLALGVSSGRRGADNQPQDSDLLTAQGFQPIGAEGTYDKKIELWIRRNEGRGPITVCRPCGLWSDTAVGAGGLGAGWGVITIVGAAFQSPIDVSRIEKASWQGRHWLGQLRIARPSRIAGLGILAVFFDDPTELRRTGGGDMAVSKWGWGDGDGLALVIYQPGHGLPWTLPVTAYAFGGLEVAGISAYIPAGGERQSLIV